MHKPFVHRVGGVLSADIAVPDHDRELDFYTRVLTTGDEPLWREDLMNNLGMPVIGLGVRTPEYSELPQQWMPHFQVADVAASAASAIELGGKELMHSQTDDGQSQWAVLEDQFGAGFGVIPVVADESNAAPESQRLGCISWLSLTTPDASSSRDFYQRVVGWSAKSIDAADSQGETVAGFEMQIDEEISAAEIRQFCEERRPFPPVWLIHLPVDDLQKSLRLVGESGGEVIKEFGESRHAIVRDPVGVHFALRAG